jgi:hypothetical protein
MGGNGVSAAVLLIGAVIGVTETALIARVCWDADRRAARPSALCRIRD